MPQSHQSSMSILPSLGFRRFFGTKAAARPLNPGEPADGAAGFGAVVGEASAVLTHVQDAFSPSEERCRPRITADCIRRGVYYRMTGLSQVGSPR